MAPVKERMKKSREKMKNDPDKWQKHLEKERSRDKIRRAEHKKIMKNSLYEMVENRKRVRDRVRAFRLRKQMAAEGNVEPPESPIGSYKCVQSFGKAVNRTKRTLPESPHKKTAVLKKLVQDIIGPEVFVQISPRKKPSTQITDEVKNTVIEFFCQDEISRQTPGIKDCVIVRKKGEGKIKYQKRYMVMTIGEAYQEFKKSHPDINIGKSTFFSLRPPYIIRVGDTPHDVCICKYHFNVINLVECIGKVIPTFPQCHKELLQNISCNVAQESCMFGDCKTCSNCKLDRVGLDSALLGRTITWKQWEDVAGRPILKQYSGSCDSAIKVLEQKLAHFKIHTYVKRVQSDYCKKLKEKIKPTEAVLQFDFAENYALISQDEVQSAHWNHSQVTVFTCCIWLEQKSVKSCAVISNDRSHSKYSVWTFLRSVIQDIKRSHEIEHLYIFTDNCAGQFKSKYTLSNLCFFLDDFGTSAEWNFFASSHGKGAMDGVGGVVKRHVWTAVKSRRVLISNAAEFYDYTKNSLINVKCLYVDKSEIDSNVPFLDKRWESTMAIPKIQSCHHFQAYDKEDILVARTSTSLMLRTSVFKNNEEEQDETPLNVRKRLKFHDVYSSSEDSDPDEVLSAPLPSQIKGRPTKIEKLDVKSGSFFLVKVASDVKKGAPSSIEYKYIAVCQNELDEEGDVKVMFLRSVSQKKNVFKADDDDVAFVKLEQLVCKLPDPDVKPQGNRLYYQFQSAVGVVEK